jgi:hypothetical protein
MKRLLIILFCLALIVVGIGFYQGWFTITSPATEKGNKVNINLEFDRDKVKEDVESMSTRAKNLTDRVTGDQQTPDDK